MKFYVVIRRKKDIGSFRKAKWVPHLDWLYDKRSDAIRARDDGRQKCPSFEFSVLTFVADGPKRAEEEK